MKVLAKDGFKPMARLPEPVIFPITHGTKTMLSKIANQHPGQLLVVADLKGLLGRLVII